MRICKTVGLTSALLSLLLEGSAAAQAVGCTDATFCNYATCQNTYVKGSYMCGSFSNDFMIEAAGNGYQGWIVAFGFYQSSQVPQNCQGSHAENIVADSSGNYCVVMPQSGSKVGCWQQANGGDPQIPYTIQAKMFQMMGDPFNSCYNNLAQLHDTSNAIFIEISPQGVPNTIASDGTATEGAPPDNHPSSLM
jgi:hypothetical protein